VNDERLASEDDNGQISFEEILRRDEARIFRLVYGLVGHVQDAEELTQEVFIKVYQKMDTFDEHSEILFWICRIARNHSLNFLKRRALVRFISMDWLVSTEKRDFPDTSALDRIQTDMELKEKQDRLAVALSQLRFEQRELIVLADIHEMPYLELSRFLKIPMGTLKSRLSRAKQALKLILEQEEADE
jgi:RNA polymerase sigma-70 factor, ECF subfamily